MRVIPRPIHGILDYVVGLALIAAPWLFRFADHGPATYVPVFLGIATLCYSLLTNYELGIFRVIPFATHLWLDIVSGVILALSPWLFGFADRVTAPHVVVGVIEILAGVMTQNEPGPLPWDRHRAH